MFGQEKKGNGNEIAIRGHLYVWVAGLLYLVITPAPSVQRRSSPPAIYPESDRNRQKHVDERRATTPHYLPMLP
jgi:hypothetical protein